MSKSLSAALIALLLLLVACSSSNDPDPDPPVDPLPRLKQEAAQNYAEIAHAAYQDSFLLAQQLKTAVDAFVAAPSQAGLDTARAAWLAARVPYGQTEAYRFYNGPIDNEQDGPEGQLNAWPMDENYVDYTAGNPNAGIINNPGAYPEITRDLLVGLNEQNGEANISTGYHAIEFLLWGQDLSANGHGERPFTDYVDGGAEGNEARRRAYLSVITDLLVEDLQFLVDAWAPGVAGNYRAGFEANDDALSFMLQGIGSLSGAELAGERMSVALDTRDQEDEHSCFSDNTHVDIRENARGIRNVYSGTYTRINGTQISGTGVHHILTEVDANLATRLNQLTVDSVTACEAIPRPFDRAIVTSDGRPVVQAAIDALRAQTAAIAEAADALGITLNLEQ